MIFLSYSSKDKDLASIFAKTLGEYGIDVWWDINIAAGKRFEKEIEKKLNDSSAIIVLWTENSIQSEWVYEEAEFAKRSNKLVPVFCADCDPPFGFRTREGARLENWKGDTDLIEWQVLLRSLEPLLGRELKPNSEDQTSTLHESGAKTSEKSIDYKYDLAVSFDDAYNGAIKDITFHDDSTDSETTLKVNIPAGIEDGQRIRLTGQGGLDPTTGERGNLYISISVAEHPIFQRTGKDLQTRAPISFTTAALGGEIKIPSIKGGELLIKIKEGVQSGHLLRLKGQGMPDVQGGTQGDLYVEVVTETPKYISPEMKNLFLQINELENKQTQKKKKKGFF